MRQSQSKHIILALLALNSVVIVGLLVFLFWQQAHAPITEEQFGRIMATLQNQSGEPGKSNALELLEKTDRVMRAWSDVGRYLVYIFGGIAIVNAALLGFVVQRIRRIDS